MVVKDHEKESPKIDLDVPETYTMADISDYLRNRNKVPF